MAHGWGATAMETFFQRVTYIVKAKIWRLKAEGRRCVLTNDTIRVVGHK